MKAYRTYDSTGAYMGRLLLDAATLANAGIKPKGDVVRIVEPYTPHYTVEVARVRDEWAVIVRIDGQFEEGFQFLRAHNAYLMQSALLQQRCA